MKPPVTAQRKIAARPSAHPPTRRALPALLALTFALLTAPASALDFRDIVGHDQRPLEKSSARADVIIFILHDCPIANAFAPEINRLVAEFQARDIRFFLVHTDPDLSVTAAQQHAKDFGYRCPVLLDPEHRLVARLKATVTPEAFVVTPAGTTAYRGRLDDRFVELGKRRPEPTRRDLRLALESILAGQPVAEPVTKAVGCFISPKKRSTP